MLIVGRIGTLELAASGIAFNLNMIVFFPMVGLAIAVSSLVGRYLGAEQPALAERAVGSALPAQPRLHEPLRPASTSSARRCCSRPTRPAPTPPASRRSRRSRRCCCASSRFYSIFDMLNLIHAAGLRGAGDTVYPMLLTLVLAL